MPGITTFRMIRQERHVEALRHADQVARHVVDARIGADRDREEGAERDGGDLRRLADAEPQDEQRQERDLRDREQRRDERQRRRSATTQNSPISPPTHTPALAPISQPAPMRTSEAPKWRASSPLAAQLLQRIGDLDRARQEQRIDQARIARRLPDEQARRRRTPTTPIGAGPDRSRRRGSATALLRFSSETSAIGHLPVGQLRLLADVGPQLLVQPVQARARRRRLAALGARDRHRRRSRGCAPAAGAGS